jgi:threonine/homoserine efflux transporter RhtA
MDALLLPDGPHLGLQLHSVIKRAFEEVPPQAFNAVRVTIAALVFLAAIVWSRAAARQSAGAWSRVPRRQR